MVGRVSLRVWVVVLLCGGLYLVGNGRVSLWDRDEPRYAQASRQMLQSGDWVVPQLLDQPRINKPPLIYWCQAAAMRVLGDNAMAARLPSAVAMTLTLVMIGVVVRRLAGEPLAFWTALVFGTSGLVVMAAKMCLTDAVLLLFVTSSQFCLYAIWRGRGTWPVVVAMGVGLGLGMLTKGPVVLGVNATTAVVLWVLGWVDRRRAAGAIPASGETAAPVPLDYASPAAAPRRNWPVILIKSAAVILLMLAIFAPWVIAVQRQLPGGLEATFKHDVLKRMSTPLEQHKGPPGYYLLFFLVSFFPWCLLMPTAVKLAWRGLRDPVARFSLAAVAGPWVMFEAIQTKLPHYVLPCFPFLAILTATAIVRGARREHTEWIGRGWRVAVGVFCGALVLIGLGPWVATLPGLKFDRLPYAAMTAVSATAGAFAVLIYVTFARGRVAGGVLAMAGSVFAVFTLLFAWYLPGARFLHLSSEIGAYLQSIGATTKGDVQMIDYKEDTLPFYQGGTIRPQRKDTFLATEPPERWPTYLTVTREVWEKAPEEAKARLEVLRTFRGWAYAAKGRVREVLVLRKRDLPAPEPRSSSGL
jgi:4-amino-4-deoxy-L-arabinose transferase-like glycosyltransferase